jgi:hypothetical protein
LLVKQSPILISEPAPRTATILYLRTHPTGSNRWWHFNFDIITDADLILSNAVPLDPQIKTGRRQIPAGAMELRHVQLRIPVVVRHLLLVLAQTHVPALVTMHS